MKTVRFTTVVEKSGKPEVYLLLSDPKKDSTFQQALKANRVLTLLHPVGKKDHGEVGYHADAGGQVLVFPRSLQAFADAQIVGIDYDLLKDEPVSKKKSKAAQPKSKPKLKVTPKPPAEKPAAPASRNVIPFTPPEPEEEEEEDDELTEIKAAIRRALKALEAGKQVAAFNLLKRVVE